MIASDDGPGIARTVEVILVTEIKGEIERVEFGDLPVGVDARGGAKDEVVHPVRAVEIHVVVVFAGDRGTEAELHRVQIEIVARFAPRQPLALPRLRRLFAREGCAQRILRLRRCTKQQERSHGCELKGHGLFARLRKSLRDVCSARRLSLELARPDYMGDAAAWQ